MNSRLNDYGIKDRIKCITADGVITNSKISQLIKLSMKLSINCGIQLGICDVFHKKNDKII